MSAHPFPAYCIIDNPLAPVACRDLRDVARQLLSLLQGRKMKISDSAVGWSGGPIEPFPAISVLIIAADSPPDHPRTEESRIILTGKGEQSISLREEISTLIANRKSAGRAV